MNQPDIQSNFLMELASIHDHQKCVGLPLCAACRAVALMKCDMDLEKAESFINRQPEGKILRLSEI